MIATSKQIPVDRKYHYIIVGSGPGGATLAKELSRKTNDILVVEYGSRFTKTGAVNVTSIYLDEKRRQLKTDGGIWVGRTRVLGGSSYVAQGNAVTPPRKRFQEWGIDLSKELESARRDLRVNPMPSHLMGEGTKRINEAAKAIGKVVNEHQETRIKGLFVSDASVFPGPLGMPSILTIVAFSKRLAKYLIS